MPFLCVIYKKNSSKTGVTMPLFLVSPMPFPPGSTRCGWLALECFQPRQLTGTVFASFSAAAQSCPAYWLVGFS